MINLDDVTKENIEQNNLNWPEIPVYPKIPEVLNLEKQIDYLI